MSFINSQRNNILFIFISWKKLIGTFLQLLELMVSSSYTKKHSLFSKQIAHLG